ncbi:Ubiquinone/menaquinone biosynthesis C-methylase UbiE [Marinitoga hydrogenitolerans DSM 16785]|uniref:Ubiquinone/menaquinone biosynthesis C-methylase UbiE n=1 Tax=Marinitoga hydrogenitolerans (strain DSM 16785 / JCM 12826 / AT1271) TaxID=1122195 RepID=A0A1M5AZ13_MARH1|nr:class I SAM-dependent methyltransferase [Marinitoga hydrogenitolerans]SHF35327.1 Ubiquinone/menaquinone biosynthesis C-methylase UbiE [Marinitoga hydrogenitolerans DSM 16785]
MDDKLKKSYDKLSKHYENDVDTKSFNAYYERPAMLKTIGNVQNLKVLDAGCGAGFYIKWLLKNNVKEVTGIDFSDNMVESAKRRVGNKAKILNVNLNKKLPFGDKYFDMIISSLTLHYVKDLNFTLSEFSRILKANGKLIFSINHPMMTYLYFSLDNYFEEILLEDRINKVPVYFYHRSFNDIFSALNKNSFLIENIIEPKPTIEFKKQDKKNYIKLNKKPHFLIIKAIKLNVTK